MLVGAVVKSIVLSKADKHNDVELYRESEAERCNTWWKRRKWKAEG